MCAESAREEKCRGREREHVYIPLRMGCEGGGGQKVNFFPSLSVALRMMKEHEFPLVLFSPFRRGFHDVLYLMQLRGRATMPPALSGYNPFMRDNIQTHDENHQGQRAPRSKVNEMKRTIAGKEVLYFFCKFKQ